ncbi:MAG: sugar phosphate isomerase/epimerase family protein [Candidatus Bipolaricaulota bacterium]
MPYFGITAFLGPLPAPEDWIEPAVEAGVDLLEIRAEPGFAHPSVVNASYARRLRRLLRAAGLQVSLHAPLHDLNPASAIPEVEAAAWTELASCVELAAELQAELLVIHPGSVPHEYPPVYQDDAERRFSFGLQLLTAQAAAKGVQPALENKQRGRGEDLVCTPEEHLRFLQEVPGLGACLDLGHMNTLELDPADYVKALEDRLVHVHLHDNHGQQDEHLPLEQGSLDWRRALASLEAVNYKGAVVLELPTLEGIGSSLALIRNLESTP